MIPPRKALVLAVVVGLGLALPEAAEASPRGRWEGVRRGAQAQAEASALAAAEEQLLAGRRLRRMMNRREPVSASALLVHPQEARRILESVGGSAARDLQVRFLHAEVLGDLGRWEEAAQALEPLVAHLPAPARVDAWVELAVAYARLGRTAEEVACYDRALSLEPHGSSRATMLANQAEAIMSTGDVTRAVQGYRASLDQLTPAEQMNLAPTTLWGLGVALDRSGDLELALDAIARARLYDPADSRLESAGWFYNPAHDEAWYVGLGHLLVARRGPDLEVREAAYQRALASFQQFVERAPASDPWLPVARARIATLTAEQARFTRRLQSERRPAPRSPPRPPAAKR